MKRRFLIYALLFASSTVLVACDRVDETLAPARPESVWLAPEIPTLLASLNPGESRPLSNGKTFEVVDAYPSAAMGGCKHYRVSGALQLACALPQWQPIRIFP